MLDFKERCAYSMRHLSRASGSGGMEVDHFDPSPGPKERRNNYHNLFPAIRLCNNHKGNHWPKPEHRAKGIHFINCCEEEDYGTHILEDPQTNLLFGTTPAGKYHVRLCDLNNPDLVRERFERDQKLKLLETRATLKVKFDKIPEDLHPTIKSLIEMVEADLRTLIPKIKNGQPPPQKFKNS